MLFTGLGRSCFRQCLQMCDVLYIGGLYVSIVQYAHIVLMDMTQYKCMNTRAHAFTHILPFRYSTSLLGEPGSPSIVTHKDMHSIAHTLTPQINSVSWAHCSRQMLHKGWPWPASTITPEFTDK